MQLTPAKRYKHLLFSASSERVLTLLDSRVDGLTQDDASGRLIRFGYNEIVEHDKNHPVVMFLKQFNSLLIYVLIIAALISFFSGHLIDVVVIGAVILFNTIVGFLQEYRAEKALAALKHALVLTASVYRSGTLTEIPISELVPGDVIRLEAGMRVPADARVLEASNLDTYEAILTGESMPVRKIIEPSRPDTPFADRKNMLWMGTSVVGGSARAVVVATGEDTMLGEVSKLLTAIAEPLSHFQRKARVVALQMGTVAFSMALVVFLLGTLYREFPLSEMFLFTIASLVSGIPEGLPAILSIVLAAGAYRMSKRHALVRTLPATETLGVTTAILTDKTGTLTQNVMMVEQIYIWQGRTITVTGSGWEARGEFFDGNAPIAPLEEPICAKLLHIAGSNPHVRVEQKESDGTYHVVGEPTEAAMQVLARKSGLADAVLFSHEFMLAEIPFSSETKYRAALYQLFEKEDPNQWSKEIYVTGAPEVVLGLSKTIRTEEGVMPLSEDARTRLRGGIAHLSHKALRVIGLAYRPAASDMEDITGDDIDELIFVGFVGMKDPIRPEVPDAIARAKRAGIRVIMATGDHAATALAIGKEIGLLSEDASLEMGAVVEGEALERMTDDEFESTVARVNAFARLEPKTKLRIAQTLQKQGHIVAMTGDGVNDALALKQADVGIAMGITGTDVARESSDIVLTNDNFASIIDAVEEGRVVFVNTRQATTFLVSTNFAEQATIVGTLVAGLPLPLLPTQILYLNLVTAAPAGLPLAAEPRHDDILDEPPRSPQENILSYAGVPFIVLIVTVMALGTLFIFTLLLPQGIERARTGAFALMAMTQLFNALNTRSLKTSLWSIGFFSNRYTLLGLMFAMSAIFCAIFVPPVAEIFKFVPLTLSEMILITLIASLVLWFGEGYKFIALRWLRA